MTARCHFRCAFAVCLLAGAVSTLAAQTVAELPAAAVPDAPQLPPPTQPPQPPEGQPPIPPVSPPTDPLPLGAGTFMGLQGLLGFQQPLASYRMLWMPDQPTTNLPGHVGVLQQAASVSTPLWHDDVNSWSISANVHGDSNFTNVILPNSGQAFPNELWSVRFGTTGSHHFDNGWIAGANVSVGSASNEPFHSIREMEVGGNGFLVIPQGEHNAWLFTLMYSPTSELPFPVPGAAFLWQPSDRLHVNVGLPFQLMYRPVDDLTFDFSYMLLRTVHARATYHLTPKIGLFTGYDWSNESYFLADRTDYNQRFFSYDQRLSTGVQAKITPNILLELSGGYVFDRFYFQGDNFGSNNNDRVDVNPGAFVGIQGRWHW